MAIIDKFNTEVDWNTMITGKLQIKNSVIALAIILIFTSILFFIIKFPDTALADTSLPNISLAKYSLWFALLSIVATTILMRRLSRNLMSAHINQSLITSPHNKDHHHLNLLSSTSQITTAPLITAQFPNSQIRSELRSFQALLPQPSRQLAPTENMASTREMVAQFAHEVGTPLSSISIHIELLREMLSADAALIRHTDIISEQIERIERLVRRILDSSRARKLNLIPLDLIKLLNKICDTTEPNMQNHSVTLIKEIEQHRQLPLILGDADSLQQVFINLINNALDAMPDGGTLHLKIAHQDLPQSKVIVTISDTGNGMDANTKAQIFDPFFTTKIRGRGNGIGLSITKQIMEEHLGNISVESAPGKGTSFHLNFLCAGKELPQQITRIKEII